MGVSRSAVDRIQVLQVGSKSLCKLLFKIYSIAGVVILCQLTPIGIQAALSLPSSGDIPEEVLRTEIITQARSPIDGKPVSAAEYAQLQAQLAAGPATPQISSDLRQSVFLLRLLKLLRTVAPFLPLPK